MSYVAPVCSVCHAGTFSVIYKPFSPLGISLAAVLTIFGVLGSVMFAALIPYGIVFVIGAVLCLLLIEKTQIICMGCGTRLLK
jgi:hypothetical protein